MEIRGPSTELTVSRAWWVMFITGLAISLVMVWRSQLQGDQLNMLIRGWYLAFGEEWLPVGMPTSAGGLSPGGLIALLVGIPLKIWPDDRAATLLVWMSGVAGYLILDRLVGRTLGPSGRLLFAVTYWLNPWRMHYTSSLWNANYLFFFGAVHAWCGFRLKVRRRFWSSVAMVMIPALGFQLHSAAAVLGFMSVFLWWRRLIRVNWWGVTGGVVATVAAYAPWALAAAARPEIVPGGTGFPLRNLLMVQPLVKGLADLVRYPSLALPARVYGLDLVPGVTVDRLVSTTLGIALVGLGWISVLLSLAAYRRFLGSRRRILWRRDWSGSDRLWLRGYVLWSLLGAVAGFAVSPTTVMFWQGFPVFHAAVLVLVLYGATVLRSESVPIGRRLVAGWLAAAVAANVLICWGSPMFRPPGPPPDEDRKDGNYQQRIAADHPMFHDLHLIERHRMVIVGQGGYMPDLLREIPDDIRLENR